MHSKVLVLAPHADDEVLGCGGTIANLTGNDSEVYIAILTNASVGAPELFNSSCIQEIRREALAAHKILGVRETYFFDLPAPCLDQYPQYKIARTLSELFGRLKPETLYIPHRGDLHLDHGAIFNAALVAARPLPGSTIRKIYAYETLSETEWGHPFPDAAFIPTHFVELDSHCLEMKLNAMSAFSSQIQSFPHSRSVKGLTVLSEYRGMAIGVNAAEAFVTIRSIERTQ